MEREWRIGVKGWFSLISTIVIDLIFDFFMFGQCFDQRIE